MKTPYTLHRFLSHAEDQTTKLLFLQTTDVKICTLSYICHITMCIKTYVIYIICLWYGQWLQRQWQQFRSMFISMTLLDIFDHGVSTFVKHDTTRYFVGSNPRDNLCITLTFRPFSRRFCPKRLTISSFATRKKPQHITVDRVRKEFSS